MDYPGVRFHTSPAFRGELTRIIGVTFAGTLPNADKTVPNQKCWGLGAGQQGGVIVAVISRGLRWLGQRVIELGVVTKVGGTGLARALQTWKPS